jgi:predicted SPOUT superfamily RNA methylase MTH1
LALLGRRLAVSIPDTVLEEKESPRDRTAKLGLIARACAIYGVDVVEVFRDPKGRGDAAEIRRVLEYLETPQYLRRRLYPLEESLKYAGILPPLRIPSHRGKVPVESVPVGQVREGVVNVDGTVDIGLDVAFSLRDSVASGRRVTVKVSSLRPPAAELVPREKVGEYWGYTVEVKTLAEVLSDTRFRVRVATSRLGKPLAESLGRLEASLRGAEGVKLIFGSPSRGLFDMVGQELDRKVEFVLNLFPGQQVETVRTEEAIFAGLGLVSLLCLKKA